MTHGTAETGALCEGARNQENVSDANIDNGILVGIRSH
jgi:hypothetical protein